jgi:hypothetical protein
MASRTEIFVLALLVVLVVVLAPHLEGATLTNLWHAR